MGQCLSAPAIGGETEEAYRARWQAGGLANGVNAFEAKVFTPQTAGMHHGYNTTADVGIPRSNEQFVYIHDKPNRLALDPIDENRSLQGVQTSPTKPQLQHLGPNSSPIRVPSTAPVADAPSQIQIHPSNWTRGELIGQGAFGSVYLGMDNDTGHLMAVKQVTITKVGVANSSKVAEHLRSLEAEVKLLQDLNHPNIVRYLGTERTAEALNIFLEYAPGGSIAGLLAKFGKFNENVVRVYTKQILQGLEYLHSNGIIHRDIKGANILVDNTGLVKLADFGASRKIEDLVTLDSGFKSVKGTPYWMAPEVIQQTGHGREADIWSVACTVIEMVDGKPPWSNYGSQVAAMFQIAKAKGPPLIPENLSPDCKDFLYLCFNRKWRERPSASRLLQHPFLAGVNIRTVAAPLNNIASAVQIPNVGVQPSADAQQQIPAYRASAEDESEKKKPQSQEIVRPRDVIRVAEDSPPRQASQGGGASGDTFQAQRMSPLRNHLASSRQGPVRGSHNRTPRRQLMLDGVEEGPSGAGPSRGGGSVANELGGSRQSSSPAKSRAPAVRASAPAFSAPPNPLPSRIDSSGGEGAGGVFVPRPKPNRRPNTAAAAADVAASSAEPIRSSSKILRSSEVGGGETLLLSDPVTLGKLRGSGNGPLQSVRNDESINKLEPELSVPSTISYSAGTTIALLPGKTLDAQVHLSGVPPAPPQPSTVRSSTTSSSEGRTPSTERASTGETSGSAEKSTVTASTAVSSAVSGQSGGYNPMEEPHWMGAGAGAVPGADQVPSPSDEATSVHPMRGSSRPGSGHGGSTDLGGVTTNPAAAGGPCNAAEAGRQSSARSGGGMTSEGPIVYTIEAEDYDFGVQVLPWDVDPGGAGSGGWAIRSTGSRQGDARASSGVGLSGAAAVPATASTSAAAAATVTGGRSSHQVPAHHPTQLQGGVDQDSILEAIRQRAARDIHASMVLFNARQSGGSSSGGSDDGGGFSSRSRSRGTSAVSSSSSSSSSSNSEAMRSSGKNERFPTTRNKLPRIEESISPSKKRPSSVPPTRIPKAPESPAGQQAVATPRRDLLPTPRRKGQLVPPMHAPSSARRPPRTPSRVSAVSPMKRSLSANAGGGGGSYEQQLLTQRHARSVSSGTYGYAAGTSRSAQSTPVKSIANHPLSTPRQDASVIKGAGRPASATPTVGRTPSKTPARTQARRAA